MVNQQEFIEPDLRVQVLSEALPYIHKLSGCTIVIKYGGAAMKDNALKKQVINDIIFLSCVGIRLVIVHGGGPEINSWLDKIGIEPQFQNGLRVTDKATMDIVEMVLVGRVNKELVSLINNPEFLKNQTSEPIELEPLKLKPDKLKPKVLAVGLSGKDGNLIEAGPMPIEGFGFVGEVVKVNRQLLDTLLDSGYVPIISSVAADQYGQAYNINADTVAGEIAIALQAEKLVLLTDTAGILRDYKDSSTLIRELTIGEARNLINEGVVSGGMIPKVQCCVRSLAEGVKNAHIIDGRIPHALLLEVLTDKGIGSMIISYRSEE